MILELNTEFSQIRRPNARDDGAEVFAIRPVAERSVLVARDPRDRPAFLIRVVDNDEAAVPLELPNLRARHRSQATLVDEAGNETVEVLSVIECRSEDTELQGLFLAAIGHVLPQSRQNMTSEQVADLVDHLAELFRAAAEASGGEILGLWGELLVIARASAPYQLLKTWHPKTEGRVDFADQHERIEVKTTTDTFRRHQLSYEQANPPQAVFGVIVSIITDEVAEGISVRVLWDECLNAAKHDADACAKLDRLCMRTLGRDWATARERQFDQVKALQTIRVISVEQVPRITSLPANVGRVRFESDMTRVPGMSIDDASIRDGGIIKSLLEGISR